MSDLAPAPFRNPGRLLLARAGNGAELLLPVGLCCAGDPAALLQQRYVLKAAAAALWIDAREESAPDRDDAGVWSLLRYLDAECSRGAPSRRPLAVFLETERLFPGGQAEFQTWLESGHARLLGALRVHVRDFAVFPWNADKLAVFRRKHCGFVFQQIYLLDKMSLMDNALTAGLLVGGKKKETVRRAAALFEKVNLPEVTWRKFPSQISGGEAQRAGIVRAVINRPEVLFADEPTGALNSNNSDAVLDVFAELSRDGQSIIMVTHEPDIARFAQKRLVMRDGRIAERG